MQIAQQSFFFFTAATAKQSKVRIFLCLDLPLRPWWITKCPTNKAMCEAERSERRIRQHPYAHAAHTEPGIDRRIKKIAHKVIIVATCGVFFRLSVGWTLLPKVSVLLFPERLLDFRQRLRFNKQISAASVFTAELVFIKHTSVYWMLSNSHRRVRGVLCDLTGWYQFISTFYCTPV